MKIKKILTVVLVCFIALAGCKKDDKSSSKNFLKYNGKEYSIDKGMLESWGKWSTDGDNNIDLTLLSDSLTIVEVNNVYDHLTGTGHGVQFWMYSTSTTELNSTTYTYDVASTEAAGTFDWGNLKINYNFDTETGDIDQYIEGGTITVSKDGSTYKITINCTDEDNKSFTGSYEGPLNFYNWSMKKSTREDKRRF